MKTNTIGTNNTVLGNAADVTLNNLTNATAIGYNAKVASSNALILGDAATVRVGIGTSNPNLDSKLEELVIFTVATKSISECLMQLP